MPLLRPLINLLLYGNFWIAACATALVWQTDLLMTGGIHWLSVPARFVFCSTLFLYAIHRIIGISRAADFQHKGRYKVIVTFRRHIQVYALLGAAGALWYFFQLARPAQWLMVPAGAISLAYVLPLSGDRRLRDLHYIKIFLIALVFALTTVALPLLHAGTPLSGLPWTMLLERCLFILAITLPFDIRDLQVDQQSRVKTLPQLLGVQRTVRLSLALLGMAALLVLYQHRLGIYPEGLTLGLLTAFTFTTALIWYAPRIRHDYYFSGLLDGTMLLSFAGVYVGSIT